MSPRLRLCILAALALASCDRPFVPLDPPSVDVLSPDLSEVQTAGRVPIVLRVTSARGVASVSIDGAPAFRLPGDDLYTDTLEVAAGLNDYLVEARGTDGNDIRDTLHVLRASPQSALAPSAELPGPLALHSATLLGDGSVLVAGGVGNGGGVDGAMYRMRETAPFVVEVTAGGSLVTARSGHAAPLLPDGRVLMLGGSARSEPATPEDLISSHEIYDPTSGVATPIASRGDPLRRSGHLAFVLTAGGRTYVYVVGGRGPLGEGLGTPSSVVIAELRGPAGADTLVTLTPPGGAGIVEPATSPAGVPLLAPGGEHRALISGLYVPEGRAVNARLRFLPGSGTYPFQVLEEALAGPRDPRDSGAMAHLDTAGTLVILLGGRDAAGVVTSGFSIYSTRASRWFHVPAERAGLRVSRFGHTATLLPSGRTAVVGGFTQPGAPTASVELVFTD